MQEKSLQELFAVLKNNIEKVIVGKDEVIEKVLISCFCSGHILLEDIPGTGKQRLQRRWQNQSTANLKECSLRRTCFLPM